MNCLIVTGGELTPEFASSFYREMQPETVIAADAGLAVCAAAGIRPDRIIGDFDSLPADVAAAWGVHGTDRPADLSGDGSFAEIPLPREGAGQAPIRIERYRAEKDWSDTELAVRRAMEEDADEIWILGATGRRTDHALANIALLYRMLCAGVRGRIVDPYCRIRMEDAGELVIRRAEQYGDYISLAPYGGPVRALTLSGFAYPLTSRDISPGEESLLLSNQIAAETATISWESGVLLVTESRDA